ncbi:DUF4386 domain-containing protein [Pseudooceanicola nitratireducens]|uniref:DUF4386 domain-containing protein n=1 Tax=Pseudooceanicola nitratireducens TaxID=517719 RepID=UPI0023F38E0D|nr:DUF4386 domain-containing protein [Pseudooceanicola nitratireducens]
MTAVAPSSRILARLAGLSYLGIIALGLGAELGLRLPIASSDDLPGALTDQTLLWRLGIAADIVMATLDIALALLLFRLLRAFGPDLALAALVLRLVQMAVIAAHLPLLVSALTSAEPQALIDRHAAGYDLGLWFFGLNALVMAVLLRRAGAPRLSVLICAAGFVYLIGSLTRFVAPDLNALMQPAYLIAVVAELSLALWLLRAPRSLCA